MAFMVNPTTANLWISWDPCEGVREFSANGRGGSDVRMLGRDIAVAEFVWVRKGSAGMDDERNGGSSGGQTRRRWVFVLLSQCARGGVRVGGACKLFNSPMICSRLLDDESWYK
jgi:hypothetical protein